MNRDEAFGRLLAIANVLGSRVFEKDKIGISEKHMTRYSQKPLLTFEKIHAELLEYADKFGQDELKLLDMFGEILSSMSKAELTNDPLNPAYLHGYHSQQNALDGIMGVEEAAELWGLSPGTIKNYCAEGKVKAKKIGKTWVIDRNQNNPKGAVKMKIDVFENGSKSKLVAMLVDDNGNERELVRTDKGRDDLLNQIDDMNLSHLTVEFK